MTSTPVNKKNSSGFCELRLDYRHCLFGCLLLLCAGLVFLPGPLHAESAECLECHEGDLDEPFSASWHNLSSAAGSGGSAGCASCHGDSLAHIEGDNDLPDIHYRKGSEISSEDKNGACLGCHEGGVHTWWVGSSHQDEGVLCADCHQVHSSHNRSANRIEQSGLCYQCHGDVRAAAKKRSRHPIEEGKTACIDCHNPHGSGTEAMLAKPTLNDNCYGCHAEKRGPFLFEHAPVAEDCSECHNPHGSINNALLTARTPMLCQQCHSAAFHPSQPQTGSGLPGAGNSQYLLGKNCMNCHTQVHGSNHPSGARMTR